VDVPPCLRQTANIRDISLPEAARHRKLRVGSKERDDPQWQTRKHFGDPKRNIYGFHAKYL